jgi:hypothetical protein
MVRAMILEPGKHAEVRFICPKKIDELVDGCPEFTVPHKGICIAVNEEGKIKGLPLNRSLVDDDGEILDIFAGTMVILGCNDKEEILSLTDEQVVSLLDEFGEPETPEDWVDDDVDFTREDLHALLDVMINKLFP